MLNNMLGETDLWHRSTPEDWPTRTRIASMMAPTIVELASGGRLATGSGGSQRIRTTLLQVLLRILAFGAHGEDAVRAPRLHAEAGRVHLERGFSEAQEIALATLPEPPELVWHERENLFFGGAHSVFQSPDGALSGVGDHRRGGLCLAG